MTARNYDTLLRWTYKNFNDILRLVLVFDESRVLSPKKQRIIPKKSEVITRDSNFLN